MRGADQFVIPAEAGISGRRGATARLHEVPAFVRMTLAVGTTP